MATCPDCGEAMLTELPHRHALDCDGKPFCPSGYAQRYHAIGQCACNDPGHIDWYPTDEERAARRKAECAEAVAAERERIRAAVEGLRVKTKGEPQDNGWQRGYRDSRNDTVAAVLAIVNPEVK